MMVGWLGADPHLVKGNRDKNQQIPGLNLTGEQVVRAFTHLVEHLSSEWAAPNSAWMLPSNIRAEDLLLKPFDIRPHKHLWLYGNVRLLMGPAHLVCVPQCTDDPNAICPRELDEIESLAEQLVLSGKILVCGIHNEVHQRAAIVPLRWGAPRVIVLGGGFYGDLGPDLNDEPFLAARLWRYQFDPTTDLVVASRPPESPRDRHRVNRKVDRLVLALSSPREVTKAA